MASRPPSRKAKAPTPLSKIKAAARAVTSKVVSAARRAAKPSPAPVEAKRAAAKAPPAPVTRVSVVRKPARGPSVRAKSAPAKPQPAKAPARPAAKSGETRRSVVRAPARGPSVRPRRAAAKAPPAPVTPAKPFAALTARSVRPAAAVPGATDAPAPSWPASPPPAGAAWHHAPGPEEHFLFPTGYGDDRIVLLVKDPWWLYAYWEVQDGTDRAARGQLLPQEVAGLQSVLRVHDVTGVDYPARPSVCSYDISLSGMATNWYINTNQPGRDFIVELGLLTNGGRFLLLVRSNRVTAPAFGPSEVVDERWMIDDELFWKLFGSSAGLGSGSSPLSWGKVMQQQLSSERWAAAAPAKGNLVKGFWCRINTDLVVYGAADPRATVLVQNQPAQVRKDGTFSLRVTVPEGARSITIDITAPDGKETHSFTQEISMGLSGTLAPAINAKTAPRAPLDPREQGGAP